jgi:hypothetical protein
MRYFYFFAFAINFFDEASREHGACIWRLSSKNGAKIIIETWPKFGIIHPKLAKL